MVGAPYQTGNSNVHANYFIMAGCLSHWSVCYPQFVYHSKAEIQQNIDGDSYKGQDFKQQQINKMYMYNDPYPVLMYN